MPPTIFPRRDPAAELLDWVERRFLYEQTQPLWLGGEAGSPGSVGPPGGYIGLLPQTRVHYDPLEEEYSGGSTSLVDNLAHDRYRLTTFMEQLASYESGGSICSGGSVVAGEYPSWGSGAQIIGFSPGSPDCAPTVQDAIQYIWNNLAPVSSTFWSWHTFMFSYEGNLSVRAGDLQIAVPGDFTIDHVYLRATTAPTGQAIIVDVNKNGTTIFTDQGDRPQIAAGANASTLGVPAVTTLELNDYLTFDVDQTGSGNSGANLTIHVRCKQYLQVT